MAYCPNCGRWFKNKQALRAHLRWCPLKNNVKNAPSKTNEIAQSKQFNQKTEIREGDFLGYHWFIKGKEGFFDVLKKIDKVLKKQGCGGFIRAQRLMGALYALYQLGIVEKFKVEPIKQS